MDYKVLYRKYRPDDFSNIIGQDYIVSILKNSIKKDKISHAYIFSGPRGTGKTSTAKVFAKAINCLQPTENGPCNKCENCLHFKENADIIELDAASNNGVDEIREIINNIKLAPSYSKYKVYIIDEVHMLSTSAFNALLLTLEEPPKHIVFILATTNIEAVPITILSRCQRFDFHKISIEDIIKRLKYVVSTEKISIEDEALEEIAYISDGGMRDALSILDQLSSNTNNITINDVISHFGSISKKQISDLYDYIVKNDVSKLDEMMKEIKNISVDYKLLIKKMLEKIEQEAINSKKLRDYKGLKYAELKELAFELASISNYVNININPYLLIEITLLKYINNNSLSPNNRITNESYDTPGSELQNISREITKNNNIEQNLHQINDNQENDFTELIKIRVNNCFVNAKKEYLKELKSNWQTLIKSIKNKSLLNLLIDTNIVAASDKIAIITNDNSSTTNLINKELDLISKSYREEFNKSYEFIAITKDEWQKEKEIYVNNLKNKKEYNYIEEPKGEEITPVFKDESKDIEKAALDIFDKNKIEIQ